MITYFVWIIMAMLFFIAGKLTDIHKELKKIAEETSKQSYWNQKTFFEK